MKLWLISQSVNNGYDTYDSAVVAAPDEQAARRINPSGEVWRDNGWHWQTQDGSWERAYAGGAWTTPDHVTATLIGQGKHKSGTVICASFNAG